MSCQLLTKATDVEKMVLGNPDKDAVDLAIDDAAVFVNCFGGTYTSDVYSLLVRYYATHLLVINGHAKVLTSMSVSDVSESYQVANHGDKESATPYLVSFNILLNLMRGRNGIARIPHRLPRLRDSCQFPRRIPGLQGH